MMAQMVMHLPAMHGFRPWVEKIPWRRKWQPTPVLLPRESHVQRNLAGCSLWGHKESDTIERTCTIQNRSVTNHFLDWKAYWKCRSQSLSWYAWEADSTISVFLTVFPICIFCTHLSHSGFQCNGSVHWWVWRDQRSSDFSPEENHLEAPEDKTMEPRPWALWFGQPRVCADL